MKKTLCITCMFILLSVPVSVFAIGFEAALGGWNQSPSGDLSYNLLGSADTLDVENDLNYDDEFKVTGRVKLDMPLMVPNIYIVGTPIEFEGEGSKTVSFNFGDETFSANQAFTSKLTMDAYDVALYYGIPFLNLATLNSLNIDLGLNVRFMDADVAIQQGGLSESESVTAAVPMAFAAIQIEPVEKFAIEAEIRGISYDDTEVLSLLGRLRVKIFGPAFAAGGYRYDSISVEEDGVDVDASIGGFFFEAGLKF